MFCRAFGQTGGVSSCTVYGPDATGGLPAVVGPERCGPAHRRNDAFASAINRADQAVRAGDYVTGLAAANDAIRSDAANYQGYYYAGVCSLRQNLLDEAERFATRSLQLAPDDAKRDVQKLVDAVQQARAYETHRRAAEAAEVQAAREWGRAYRARTSEFATGLKAASMLAERGELVEAVLILRLVEANAAADADALAKAKQALEELAPKVAPVYTNHVEAGWRALDAGKNDAAAAEFRAALAIDPGIAPDSATPRHPAFALATVAAARSDREGILAALASAARAGLQIDATRAWFGADAWNPWRKDALLLAFLEDVFGRDAVEALQSATGDGTGAGRVAVTGFTWLREETFSCGGQSHRVQIYRCDAFARAGATGPACEFVLVPAGSFDMGSDNGGHDEKPVHRVSLGKPFLLARTEVTRQVWKGLVGTTGLNATPSNSNAAGSSGPVDAVSWNECRVWCRANHLRLPSEAEWEYACRAGTTTRFSFGDADANLGAYARFEGNSVGGSYPVASKGSNAFGLYDMHGNVWEWCQDNYKDNYQDAPTDGSAAVIAGATFRVYRGGSHGSEAHSCRSANRSEDRPHIRYSDLGFRPARSVD